MNRPRILVADDKENFIKLVTTILGSDFDVVGAEDGQRALARVTADDFDVVLTDLKMPGATA
jgi:CheY-like chemotaxis protein